MHTKVIVLCVCPDFSVTINAVHVIFKLERHHSTSEPVSSEAVQCVVRLLVSDNNSLRFRFVAPSATNYCGWKYTQ